jgi:diguanylate cyclase (GGDEF)-like protein/PAS domain S-box-containing protein
LLLALGLLLLGSVWWLVLGLLPPDAHPVGASAVGARPTELPLLVALVAVASASLAVGLVVRSRQRALVTLKTANLALRQEIALSRSIVELQTEWITRYDADLRLTFVNGAFAQMMKRSPEELVGKSMGDFMDEENLARMRGQLATLRPEQPSATFDTVTIQANGSKQHKRWTDLAVFDAEGRVREYLSVGRDVTDQKVAELALRASEARRRTVASSAPIVLFALNQERVFTMAEGHGLESLGVTSEQVVGAQMRILLKNVDGFFDAVERTLGGEEVVGTFKIAGRWFEIRLAPQRDERDAVVAAVGVGTDVTDRWKVEQELRSSQEQYRSLAFHDTLTGLPNRALFGDRLEQALLRAVREGHAVAVLFLDLDNFKVVNDSLGHQVGDDLLVQVSARITSCLRAEDTAARLGGDELAVLIGDIQDASDAESVADRLADALRAPFRIAGRDVVVTASIGVALSAPDRTDRDTLLQAADLAMYQAKANGRARYELFDPSMAAEAGDRLELEMYLRDAIDREELSVVYQPIVSLQTGRVSAVEALVRWEHPERGPIGPARFIPIAEETGLISSIGAWVMRRACRDAATWPRQGGTPLAVSVNVSPRQLRDPGFVDEVRDILTATGLEPSQLQIEVTESAVMHDPQEARTRLEQLQRVGVSLAIDDFGTGYSSLGQLRHFPFDSLKVDRTFMLGLGQDQTNAAIVSGVIALARNLGLAVVGEGIETRAQLEQLQALGCDRGQGYYLARPLSPESLSKLLANDTRLVPPGADAVANLERGAVA